MGKSHVVEITKRSEKYSKIKNQSLEYELDIASGVFKAEEAMSRLMPLINNQLSYLALRDFQNMEHIGRKDKEASQQLETLTNFKKLSHQRLGEAVSSGKPVKLKARIEFSIS